MGFKRKDNYQGWNVAHVGAQCSSGSLGLKMLEKASSAELSERDLTDGFTPLHWAVLADNPKAVLWLLRHGADRSVTDFLGRRAEDLVGGRWGEYHQRHWEYLGS